MTRSFILFIYLFYYNLIKWEEEDKEDKETLSQSHTSLTNLVDKLCANMDIRLTI